MRKEVAEGLGVILAPSLLGISLAWQAGRPPATSSFSDSTPWLWPYNNITLCHSLPKHIAGKAFSPFVTI